jgi:hypothetical protein
MDLNKVMDRLKTIGLIAKGAVYIAIGILAAMAALDVNGQSEEEADNAGAFHFLQQNTGNWMLGLLAAGLTCYSVWRFYEAFNSREKRSLPQRGRYFFSALSYGALAFSAFKVISTRSSGDGNPFRKYAAQAMQLPFGEWLIILAALVFVSAGIYQVYYGLAGKYRKHVEGLNLHDDASALLAKTGLVGYIARGLVWLLVAYLLLRAALHHSSKEAGGPGEAFDLVNRGTAGAIILAIIAAGLVAYGVFCLIRAKFDRR